jgi:hypothetical protein
MLLTVREEKHREKKKVKKKQRGEVGVELNELLLLVLTNE